MEGILWLHRELYVSPDLQRTWPEKPKNEYQGWWSFVQMTSEKQKDLCKWLWLGDNAQGIIKDTTSVWSKLKCKKGKSKCLGEMLSKPFQNSWPSSALPRRMTLWMEKGEQTTIEGQTAEEAVSGHRVQASCPGTLCWGTTRPCKWDYWATLLISEELWKMGDVSEDWNRLSVVMIF